MKRLRNTVIRAGLRALYFTGAPEFVRSTAVWNG
jgi:hypothetical protein